MLRLLEWVVVAVLVLFFLVIAAAGVILLVAAGPVVAIAVVAFIVVGAWAAKENLRTRWAQWRGLGVNLAEEPPGEYTDPDIHAGSAETRRFNEAIDPDEARRRLPD